MQPKKWGNSFARHVEELTESAIHATAWIIFVSGYALSAVVFLRWLFFSFVTLATQEMVDPKELMHTLLLSIELLILVPVPGIVGVVSYRTLTKLGEGGNTDLKESQLQVGLAEHLLIGLLVTVTGTTLLDLLITETGTWLSFGGGAILIFSLSFFYLISRH